jgi:branched-chain amino acid transport system ATP-binding protein
MTALLYFKGVDAGYGGARILNGFDVSIDAGDSVAILGRNGVGMTTFVTTFLGVAKLFQGVVSFSGRKQSPIKHFNAARSGIAVVLQVRGLFSNRSVRETLRLGAGSNRVGPWNVESVYHLFPILRERADTPGTALSEAQQQMLAIGRALIANPALLVLDEPSEGLAPVIIDELVEVFRRLAKSGTSLLLIEQNYSIVKRLSDRYYVLSKGSVVEQEKPGALSMESIKKHVAVRRALRAAGEGLADIPATGEQSRLDVYRAERSDAVVGRHGLHQNAAVSRRLAGARRAGEMPERIGQAWRHGDDARRVRFRLGRAPALLRAPRRAVASVYRSLRRTVRRRSFHGLFQFPRR